MKTNRLNAPFSYQETGKPRPVDESRPAPPPRLVRVYHCVDCRQPGGTLRNIGNHQKPIYICTACKKRRELLAMRRRP